MRPCVSELVIAFLLNIFEYTLQDRLFKHTHQINGGAIQLLAKNEYDELGQLIVKRFGGTDLTGVNRLQRVNYSYNVRRWLTYINEDVIQSDYSEYDDLFYFKVNYNNVDNDISGAIKPLYNGNIAETTWTSTTDFMFRRYGYQYDHLGRLLNAIYQKPDNAVPETNSYNESLTYDKNGNIISLQRNGECDDPVEVIQTDDLAYTYDSNNPNQLIKVVDSTNNPKGFSDGATVSTDVDYQYDANGNMIRDKNKDINISYNHLNLPIKIIFASSNYIEYLYNAVGQKVKKVVKNGAVTTTTDYLSGYQYVNNVLEFFPTAEGYVKNTVVSGVNNYNYIYNYTDHLGNIRLSYTFDNATSSLKIVEENNYYPFGLKHKNYNQDIRTYQGIESGEIRVIPAERLSYQYKFSGNEFQDELGLNLYDYDNRIYDPAIGKFLQMDPLAENGRRWSPYNYCFNNPVYFQDPDGMWPWPRWVYKAKDFVVGTYNGAKGYVSKAVQSKKAEIQKAFTSTEEFGNFVVNNHGLTVAGNMVLSTFTKPANIVNKLSKGDFKGAGEAYGEHLAEGGVALATGGAAKAGVKLKGTLKVKPSGKSVSTAEAPVTNEIYSRPNNATTPKMREYVNELGQEQGCSTCGVKADKYVADHKTPLVQEFYETGTIDLEAMRSIDAVQPQCSNCSAKQGAEMSKYSKEMKSIINERTQGGN